MLDKANGFVRDYDGTKCLVLFSLEIYDVIYDRIRDFIGLTASTTVAFLFNYPKIKIDWNENLHLEETLTLHNAIIFIKSVLN